MGSDNSVRHVLEHVRSLFFDHDLPDQDLTLEILGGKLARNEPVDPRQSPSLFDLLKGPNITIRLGLARLFMHPWHNYEPVTERRAFIASDIRGMPVAAMRTMHVSKHGVDIDMELALMTGTENGFTTIEYNGFDWTMSKDISDEPNDVQMRVGADEPDTAMFIPAEFLGTGILTSDSGEDTHLLLRSFLEEIGFYRSEAILARNIRILNPYTQDAPDNTPVFKGYAARHLPKDAWMPLFVIAPAFEGTALRQGVLNQSLSLNIAAAALRNLEFMVYALKESGIAMRSWNHLQVNMRTGELALGEGDRPILLNSTLLETAMADSEKFMAAVYAKEPRTFFQNLTALASGSSDLRKAEGQLTEVVRILTHRARVSQGDNDVKAYVEQVLRDFELYTRFTRDAAFMDSMEDYNKRETIKIIVEHYIDVLGTNGILNFMKSILPAVITTTPFENWFDRALELINEAIDSEEKHVEYYWAKNEQRIWNMRTVAVEKKPAGGSSPAGRGSVGNPGTPPAGSDLPPIPQAKGAKISALLGTNEELPPLPVAPAVSHPATDVAAAARPFTMLPAVRITPVTNIFLVGAKSMIN